MLKILVLKKVKQYGIHCRAENNGNGIRRVRLNTLKCRYLIIVITRENMHEELAKMLF